MKLGRLVGLGWLVRRLFGEVRAVRVQLERQNDLFERLADRFAPRVPAIDPREVSTTTGVDYLDPSELQLAIDYAERMERDTGHRPTDDELLVYLADEKTVDLHARLVTREQELDRLTRDRRGR